ncbi:DUF202 domain-containing protein [Streptomyces halstedii]|uniref:DUF202 domain-containing protein n=1 Tax=Streptomyces TaxID=1883 RepID=UPI000804D094|nr:DUF202 domain-containing protein [Streptomyces sp. OspMP-M45]MYR74102.1 DUF202 domain-containing protein [Streptomyces sp. SID4925]SBU91850.1 protein of unknown function (DUF202) [Streptomyces sp. OspMP-M45]
MTGSPRDPGLQPERTRLAWRRTTLSCTVVTLLAVRQAVRGGADAAALTGLATGLVAWLGFLRVAHRRVGRMGAAEPAPLVARHALAAVACTVVLAVCAAVMLF